MEDKILILGDTHGNFEIIKEIFRKEDTTGKVVAILHAGDLGVYDNFSLGTFDEFVGGRLSQREARLIVKHENPVDEFQAYIDGDKEFPVPFFCIPGNHEDFELYQEFTNGKREMKNFIPILPDKVYSIELGGKEIRFAGFGKITPHPGKTGLAQHFTKNEYGTIWNTLKENPVDIFLLHEPLLTTAKRKENYFVFGNSVITDLVENSKIDSVFIGHMHFEYLYNVKDTKVHGLGYGVVGKYCIYHSDHSVTFHSLEDKEIVLKEAMPGSHLQRIRQEEQRRLELKKAEAKEAKRIKREMGRLPYDLHWLQEKFPIKIETKEEKKDFKQLFLKICELYYAKKPEEDILVYAKDWLEQNGKL
ncbi:MAG: metallophosphoesterase [Leptospiraceae bacterium]|nr:metallophosphoesterase [Leptospiraceae bacterium]